MNELPTQMIELGEGGSTTVGTPESYVLSKQASEEDVAVRRTFR